jgi:hypothetical protein
MMGAVVKYMVERVIGEATWAVVLLLGNVRPEPSCVLGDKGMADGKVEGSGSGVLGEVRCTVHSVGGCFPEWVVVPTGWFGEGVFVCEGVPAITVVPFGLPFVSPPGCYDMYIFFLDECVTKVYQYFTD